MKKIGLMTWFSYDNFGSLLQCKATMKSVEKLGYEIELINYVPKQSYSKIQNISIILKKIILKIIKRFLYIFSKKDMKKISLNNMNIFRKNMKKSRLVLTKSDLFLLNKEYDSFICGSDQVWAPTVYDENYFLSFVEDDNKKIAYAPSIGLPVIENKFIKENMKKLISNFIYLSTREEQGAKLIKDLIGKEAKVVLDPTLLLNKEDWEKEMVDIKYENYILAYFLGDNKKYYIESQKIAKILNKQLLIIPTNNKDLNKKECIQDDLGPQEFISLINKADLVLTDSFHGTIFSINFHKPFITFKRFIDNNLSQNSRIYNILKKLNLEELIFNNNYKIIEYAKNIDYKLVEEKLLKLRNESLNFLKDSLEKSTNSLKEKAKVKVKITNNCTGCGVCVAVCPKDCIRIKENDFGFFEYKIDHSKCISCNICSEVCGQANFLEKNYINDKKLYSAYSTKKDILLNSTSGGVCTTIAYNAIEKNKSVISCEYDYEKNRAILNIANTIEQFDKMKGSKYLQAFSNNIYKKLKELEEGVIIGTPCQIASVDLYLNLLKKREKFLLVDFICHGVPSYKLWDKYIKSFDKIEKILFRNKEYSWRNKYITIINNKISKTKKENSDLFYHFFNIGNNYNDCCYECKYRDSSLADIRVGDYWGPKFKNNKTGISMVISFTSKGEEILKELKGDQKLILEEQTIEDYLNYQQTKNFRKPLEYYEILEELKDNKITLKEIDKKYNFSILRRNNLRKKIYSIKNILRKR